MARAEALSWPEIFHNPHIQRAKLKQKHPKRENESSEWDNIVMNPGKVNFEEAVFCAKEFFLSKGRSPPPGSSSIKGIRKKKPFVPPLPKGARAYRAPINMLTDCEAVWIATPAHINTAPKKTVSLRPMPSDMYGENG